MATTPNLGIPLLEGTDVLARQKFNEALQQVDAAALSVSHEDSKAHWPMWEPNKEYFLVNIVRTETCPEWGYLECTQPGISGSVVPADLFGEGDTKNDGSVIWTLRRIGGGTKHGDLTGRTLPDQHPIHAITGLEAALASKEDPGNKGQPDGYASLDSTGHIPITQLPTNVKEMRVVANIAARNALVTPELYDGLRVRVLDATADPTVAEGWAEYVWDESTAVWIKLSEKESMDVVLKWGNLQEVPQVIKDIGDTGGRLTYKGEPVHTDVRAVTFIGGEAEILYPWSGTVQQIKIISSEDRLEDLQFNVELQPKADFIVKAGNWLLIGGATLILPAGQVYKEYLVSGLNVDIAAGDVLRASTVGDDTGITFIVMIKNN